MNARFGNLGGKRFTPRNQCGIMQRPVGASHLPGRPNQNGSRKDHVMASKPLPSPEVLRQLLRYEPETGKLFWLPRPRGTFPCVGSFKKWHTRYCGKLAGTSDPRGYIGIRIFGRRIWAHRAAYAIYHGQWPAHQVDHIDGDRSNNRIGNLRACDNQENSQNCKLFANNTSGFCGVTWNKQMRTWQAQVKHRGKSRNLGNYKDKQEAIRARQAFNDAHGFSDRHGVAL